MIKVEDMMTRSPHTLLRSDKLIDAKEVMEKHEIRHVPIVDSDNKLYGIVTQRDILAAQESSLHKVSDDQSYTLNTPLNDMMHTNLMTADPKAGLKEKCQNICKSIRSVACQ